VDAFHDRLRTARFGQIFADAAPDYHRAMNLQASEAFFAQVSTSLGSPGSYGITGVQVNYTTGGTLIVLQAETKFDRGSAHEQFTWRLEGQRALLVGYNLSNPVLAPGP